VHFSTQVSSSKFIAYYYYYYYYYYYSVMCFLITFRNICEPNQELLPRTKPFSYKVFVQVERHGISLSVLRLLHGASPFGGTRKASCVPNFVTQRPVCIYSSSLSLIQKCVWVGPPNSYLRWAQKSQKPVT
jgi:hypothetical protein